ncbi:MAG: hypothetical protein JW720_09070 [Sedimentisphaerales bacterium]|nr:hypothetical protein [Sedimentisphaerales bacterium]
MSLRFYTNAVTQASRTFATGAFIVGLMLIGFGTIIWALPELFAFIAAAVFFLAGIGCIITAVKIFLAQRRFCRTDSDDSQSHRENVRIHSHDHYGS